MHSWPSLPRWWRIAIAGATVLVATLSAGATDVSGTFADKGTVVPTDPTHPLGEVSLHALLSLDFDAARASIRYSTTDALTLSQSATALDVQVYDRHGAIAWRGRFPYQYGVMAPGQSVVVLKLRVHSSSDGAYLLVLEPIEGGKLLQVAVTRLSPTVFGVSAQPVGTYLFYRVPTP